MKTKKVIRICVWFIAITTIVCLPLILTLNQGVMNNTDGKFFLDVFIKKEFDVSKGTKISFLGKPIVMNDMICEQISAIADQDTMLSYKDSILQIGDVSWRVNIDLPYVVLLTSVQPDDPKMKQVVKYLTGIYGKPYDEEEDGFSIKWSSPGSTMVHLRRVHTEEGGTFLFFID